MFSSPLFPSSLSHFLFTTDLCNFTFSGLDFSQFHSYFLSPFVTFKTEQAMRRLIIFFYLYAITGTFE